MPWVCDGDISKSWKSLYCLAVLATGLVPRQGLITKPVGFRSLPFSFLADTDSRNRTFVRHVDLSLAEDLARISRYLQRHLRRITFCHIHIKLTSKHPSASSCEVHAPCRSPQSRLEVIERYIQLLLQTWRSHAKRATATPLLVTTLFPCVPVVVPPLLRNQNLE